MKDVAEMLDNLQTEDGSDIVYDDVLSGSEMQDLHERINITTHDTILSSSLDGAQLYQNKKSDTWISIWILHNFSPNQRYQKGHVFPGTIIPGPNKPKNIDSFLFRGTSGNVHASKVTLTYLMLLDLETKYDPDTK